MFLDWFRVALTLKGSVATIILLRTLLFSIFTFFQ